MAHDGGAEGREQAEPLQPASPDPIAPPPGLCLDCARATAACAPGHRLVQHPALWSVTIAHLDCDAFYASVEKRDRPELADQPVIVGGGRRGVVTTACYQARRFGVRSAMPMFQARRLCPAAHIIAPDFRKYAAVAAVLRTMLRRLTPLVLPLSIDEAVLDLAGTAALHGAPPAVVMARLARAVEAELGITVSIGLGPNRLLAKLAAERHKPRGFCVLAEEAPSWLATQPVGLLPGIGAAATRRLAALGITNLGQIQAFDPADAIRRLGPHGPDLVARARGQDPRPVRPETTARSISAETTFAADLADRAALERALWPLCEKLARRLRATNFAASAVTLKLKTQHFATRTRTQTLPAPTALPETLFAAASSLLELELDGTRFRLLGIGTARMVPLDQADRGDLIDRESPRRRARQAALDRLAARFGDGVVTRGAGFTPAPPRPPGKPRG